MIDPDVADELSGRRNRPWLLENIRKCEQAGAEVNPWHPLGLEECHGCKQLYGWYIVTIIDTKGRPVRRAICVSCGVTSSGGKIKDNADAPIIDSNACPKCGGPGCQRCSEMCVVQGCESYTYVERHHWAPWAAFGGDAELWPISNLCKEHHDAWHRVMGHGAERKAG